MTWMSKLKDSGNIGLIANILAIFLGILVLSVIFERLNIVSPELLPNTISPSDVLTQAFL